MRKFFDYLLLIFYPIFALFVLADLDQSMGPRVFGRDLLFYAIILAFLVAGFFFLSQSLQRRRREPIFRLLAALLLVLYFLFPLWNTWLPASISGWVQNISPSQSTSVAGFYLAQLIMAYI